MIVFQVQCRRAVAAGLHSTLQTRLPGCLVGHHDNCDDDDHHDDNHEYGGDGNRDYGDDNHDNSDGDDDDFLKKTLQESFQDNNAYY